MKCSSHIYTLFLCLFMGIFADAQNKNIAVGYLETATTSNTFAFVVGNDHYKDPSISTLASCRLDAERFGFFLKSDSGFNIPSQNVIVLLDANKEQFIKRFNKLLNTTNNESTFYFYYSGHGIKGGLLPTDFSSNEPQSYISYSWIKQSLKDRNIKFQLFMIDACYSGSLIKEKSIKKEQISYLNAIVEDSGSDDFVMFTATTAFRVTPAGQHASLYTSKVLSILNDITTDINHDKIVTTGELQVAIENELSASNTPQFFGNEQHPIALVSSNNVVSPLNISAMRTSRKATKNTIQRTAETSHLVKWRTYVEAHQNQSSKLKIMITDLENESTPLAKAKLGFLYREGIGVTKNNLKALQYFISATYENDSFGIYNLGYMYITGRGVTQDCEKGIAYFEKAAEANDPFAQYNLGNLYNSDTCDLVQKSTEKAISYYKKATEQNFAKAHLDLGRLYFELANENSDSFEIRKLNAKGLFHIKNAAIANNANAQYEMGNWWSEKSSKPHFETETSSYWFKRACDNDHLIACSELLNRYTKVTSSH